MSYPQAYYPGPGPPASGPSPGGPRRYPHRMRRERRGVLGVVLGLVGLGICGLVMLALLRLQVGSAGVVVGTMCALLPVGPVVAAFLWLDRWEPEPPRLLLLAFLWGACFATLAALFLNTGAEMAGAAAYGKAEGEVIGAVFVAPWVEEAMKGAFVVGISLWRRREFDGVLDGVVYAGVVAAGFAFTENILYLGGAFVEGHVLFFTFIIRAVLSPFAHPLFTSMTGIGLGIAANARHPVLRVLAPVGGYLTAVFLHGLWNASTALGGSALVVTYVLIMFPLFTFMVALMIYQRRREQRVIGAELPGFAQAGWIAQSEVRLLQSLAGRRGWLLAVRRRAGPAVAKLVAQYQSSVTELAILRHRMARGALGPHAWQWHDELLEDVLVKRARAVGAPEALVAAWGRQAPPPGWSPPPARPPSGPGQVTPHQPGHRPGSYRPGSYRPGPPGSGPMPPAPRPAQPRSLPPGAPPGWGAPGPFPPGPPPVPPPRQGPPR